MTVARTDDIYAKALAALAKPDREVTGEDRAAVAALMEKLRDENNRGTGSRLDHFRRMVVGYPAIAGGDQTAKIVFNNFDEMPRQLDRFAIGKSIEEKLKEAVIWYVKAWQGLAEGEHRDYNAMRAVLKKMGTQRA